MNKFKIIRDDLVVVTAGKYKGQTGKVLKVHRDISKVTIEKINLVKRKLKPNQERAGGVVEKESPLHISNVALWNAEENRRVKVGFKFNDDGKKVRYDKKTNAIIG